MEDHETNQLMRFLLMIIVHDCGGSLLLPGEAVEKFVDKLREDPEAPVSVAWAQLPQGVHIVNLHGEEEIEAWGQGGEPDAASSQGD